MARTGQRLAKEVNTIASPELSAKTVQKTKGRNALLIASRDEQLLYRYYYHTYIKQKKHEVVFAALEKEFSLTTRHLLNIIYSRVGELKELSRNKPTIGQLIRKYPHFAWSQS